MTSEGFYGSLHIGSEEHGLAHGFEKFLIHFGVLNGPDIILHTGTYQ